MLMASKHYRRRQLEKRKAWSRNAHAAKERKRQALADEWRDVGGFVTDGCLGKHTVRLLMSEDYSVSHYAVLCDGRVRQPRTRDGVLRCLRDMVSHRPSRPRNPNAAPIRTPR